jgi:hypothetical protein
MQTILLKGLKIDILGQQSHARELCVVHILGPAETRITVGPDVGGYFSQWAAYVDTLGRYSHVDSRNLKMLQLVIFPGPRSSGVSARNRLSGDSGPQNIVTQITHPFLILTKSGYATVRPDAVKRSKFRSAKLVASMGAKSGSAGKPGGSLLY